MLSDEYNNKISTYCLGRNKVCEDGDKKNQTIYYLLLYYIIYYLCTYIFKKGQLQIAINLALKKRTLQFSQTEHRIGKCNAFIFFKLK